MLKLLVHLKPKAIPIKLYDRGAGKHRKSFLFGRIICSGVLFMFRERFLLYSIEGFYFQRVTTRLVSGTLKSQSRSTWKTSGNLNIVRPCTSRTKVAVVLTGRSQSQNTGPLSTCLHPPSLFLFWSTLQDQFRQLQLVACYC